jgi:hypothetical protein
MVEKDDEDRWMESDDADTNQDEIVAEGRRSEVERVEVAVLEIHARHVFGPGAVYDAADLGPDPCRSAGERDRAWRREDRQSPMLRRPIASRQSRMGRQLMPNIDLVVPFADEATMRISPRFSCTCRQRAGKTTSELLGPMRTTRCYRHRRYPQ